MKEEEIEPAKYNADFLWGNDDNSIKSLGYEFANAQTEEYQKECWAAIIKHFNQESRKAFEAGRLPNNDMTEDFRYYKYETFEDYLASEKQQPLTK